MAPESGCHATPGEKLQVMVLCGVDDLSGVCILCDDKGIALLDKPPFSTSVDTATLAAGNHVLKAVACRKNGDKITSDPVPFTVAQSSAAEALPSSAKAILTSAEILKDNTNVMSISGEAGGKAVLHAGIPVHLRTVDKLANGVTPVGAVVGFVVAEDVLGSKNEILIPRGTPAYGKCVESEKPKMLGKGGKLSFTVDNVVAADGTSVPLKLEQERETGGPRVFSGPTMSGHNIWVDPGTLLTAQVEKDTEVAPGPIRVNGSKTPSGETATVEIAGKNSVARGDLVELRLVADPSNKVKSVSILLDGAELEKLDNGFASLSVRTPSSITKGAHSIAADVVFNDGYALESTVQLDIR